MIASRRSTRVLLALAVLVAVYAVLGFWVAPGIARRAIETDLSTRLSRPLSVESLSINPFLLSVRARGVSLVEKNGDPILGLDELEVDLSLRSVLFRALVLDEIRLVAPKLELALSEQGRLNVLDLVPPSETEQAPSEGDGLAVIVEKLRIEQGAISLTDRRLSPPLRLEWSPVHLEVDHLATQPDEEGVLALTATSSEGEGITISARASLEPTRLVGGFGLAEVRGRTLLGYARDRVDFELASGQLSVAGSLDLGRTASGEPSIAIHGGEIFLESFAITRAGREGPVLALPALAIHGIEFDLAGRTLNAAALESRGGGLDFWLEPDGRPGILDMLPAPAPAAGAATPPESQAQAADRAWRAGLGSVEIEGFVLDFEDGRLDPPASVARAEIGLKVRDLSNEPGHSAEVEATVRLRPDEDGPEHAGLATARGSARIDPVGADLEVTVEGLLLAPLESYLQDLPDVALAGGHAELSGQLHYDAMQAGSARLTFGGDLGLRSLEVASRSGGETVFALEALDLAGVALERVGSGWQQLRIEEVSLKNPKLQLAIAADGRSNLQSLVPTRSEGDAAAPPEPAGAPPPLEVGLLRIEAGRFGFRDGSVSPPVQLRIEPIDVELRDFRARGTEPTRLDARARIAAARLRASGALHPAAPEGPSRVEIDLDGMDLTPFSPYAGRYVGRRIAEGRLSLDLDYGIERSRLSASNGVRLDGFEFGESVASPDASKLPVSLALALMKDREGSVRIDLPVTGDLADPSFRLTSMLAGAATKLIQKTVASPFAVLGGVVGGADLPLDGVDFVAGEHDLDDRARKILDVLTDGLGQRPDLRLEIEAVATRSGDGRALARRALEQELASRSGADPASIPPEQRASLLTEIYRERFGAEPAVSELPEERLIAAAPVPDVVLQALAQQRAQAIRQHLRGQGSLPDERIAVVGETIEPGAAETHVRSLLRLAGS